MAIKGERIILASEFETRLRNIQNQINALAIAGGVAPAGNYITALTGEVTASGPGSAAATIAAKAVSYAKIQDVAANKLLGSVAGGSVEEIACTAAGRALLDDATAAAQATTLGLGTTDGPTFDHVHLAATTDSTSMITGCAICGGGVGIAGALNVGGNIRTLKGIAFQAGYIGAAGLSVAYSVTFEAIDNTTLRIHMMGGDAVVRHADLTLV